MNDDERGDRPPVSEHTTAPPDPVPAPPSGGWKMPEPKFQQSSGYLPQGYIEKLGLGVNPQAGAAAPAMAPQAELPEVEPQPDISESPNMEAVATAPVQPAKKQRSTGARVMMILLGLLAMAAFIAIFLTVIYYLFLRSGNGSGQF